MGLSVTLLVPRTYVLVNQYGVRSVPVLVLNNLTQREIRSRPEFDFVEVKDLRFSLLCDGLGTFRLTVPYILICPCFYKILKTWTN